mgnify:CR=1 FL=1
MNHFLKHLDIKKFINIEIIISPIAKDYLPFISLHINKKKIFDGPLHKTQKINDKVDLLENIEIFILSKNNNALTIDSLTLDGFQIIPDYNHHITYFDSNNKEIGPSNFLGVSGEWNFSTTSPFYIWKHHVTDCGWLLNPHSLQK